MGLLQKAGGSISSAYKKSDVGRAVGGSTDGFNKGLDVNRKNFNKSLPALRTIGGATLGGMIAGPLGALVGTALTAPKKGSSSGGGATGAQDGGGGGGGPQLSPWVGISSLGEKGVLTPSLVTGQAIQSEMENSPWYQMALKKQAAEQDRLLGQTQQQQAGQLAQARGQLAMRGGLRGGSAERLAMGGAESGLLASQNIRGSGAMERGQLGMQGIDLARKTVEGNVGAQNTAQQFNIQNQIADLTAQNARNLAQYQEQMKMLGANATADAIRRSGGGGGFFQNPVGATQATFKKIGIGG